MLSIEQIICFEVLSVVIYSSLELTTWFLFVLQEWSEDYFFLELRLEDACQSIESELEFDLHGENSKDIGISGLEGTIFDGVISLYAGFSKDQITNLVSIITGKFERCCKSYSSSMTSWLVVRFDSVNGESYPFVSCGSFFLNPRLGKSMLSIALGDFALFGVL